MFKSVVPSLVTSRVQCVDSSWMHTCRLKSKHRVNADIRCTGWLNVCNPVYTILDICDLMFIETPDVILFGTIVMNDSSREFKI